MNQKQLGAEEQPRLLNVLQKASTYAVVWRFLGDLHVVDMGVTISVTPAPGVPRPEFDVTATLAEAAKAAGIYEEKSN